MTCLGGLAATLLGELDGRPVVVGALSGDEGVVGGVRQRRLVLADDLDDRGEGVLLDALVELVDDLVALDARAARVVHLRDGGGDGVGDVVAGAGGRLVRHLLVHTGDGVLGVDVDVVVPLGGVVRVGHRQGDDEVLGRDDLVRGPGLADEVGADLGLSVGEGGQTIPTGGDRLGGVALKSTGLDHVTLGVGKLFPALGRGQVHVQLGNGELDTGHGLALDLGVRVTRTLLDAVGVGLFTLVDGQCRGRIGVDGGSVRVSGCRRAGRGDERACGERHRCGEAEASTRGEGVHCCSLLCCWDE